MIRFHLSRFELLAAVLLVLAVGRVAAAAQPVSPPAAQPVEGGAFAAELMTVDKTWQLKFAAGQSLRQLSAADLVWWGSFVDMTAGPQIVLADGGLLLADVLGLDKDVLHTEGELLGERDLPLEAVAGVIWHPPGDRTRRDQLLRQVRSCDADADLLILDNGDTISGTVTGLASPESPAVGEPSAIKIQAAAGPLELSVSRVAALVFNPALAAHPRPTGLRAILGFADGSRVVATELSLSGGTARLQVPVLGDMAVHADKLVAIQPLGGRAVYLSDLKAASYKFIPFLQLGWPYHRDANVAGNLLRAAGKLYLKGLGVHSASRLTYDLDGPYRAFQAELAIDDAAQGLGSVEFRVFVDTGDGKWQPRYSSPVQRGGMAPTTMNVDLAGAKRISLLVEFADRGDERDDADWLNARLIK